MITKNQLRSYASLLSKKGRDETGLFIVEGLIMIEEALNSGLDCQTVIAVSEYAGNYPDVVDAFRDRGITVEYLKNHEFKKISDTVTPQGIAGVFRKGLKEDLNTVPAELVVYLDEIADPGNVGTIIRTCDWFGISSVILSPNCADIYNPKTIRSSMGSVFHLSLSREEYPISLLKKLKGVYNFNVLCADTDGDNVFNFNLSGRSVIVLSNEAKGPSPHVKEISDNKITIPGSGKAESLNVAAAAAVIISRFTAGLSHRL